MHLWRCSHANPLDRSTAPSSDVPMVAAGMGNPIRSSYPGPAEPAYHGRCAPRLCAVAGSLACLAAFPQLCLPPHKEGVGVRQESDREPDIILDEVSRQGPLLPIISAVRETDPRRAQA